MIVVVWSDVPARTLHIRKYEGFFNWTKTARVYAPHTDGVAIDWVHGLLFRADFDLMRIIVMDLRLKHRLRERALISTDLEAPRAIAVDPSCGVIFWSDWGAHRIERAGMDGQERVIIASGDQIYWPNGLALDIPARRIYWVEANTDTSSPKKGIYSADYWGHDLQTISQSVTFSHPFAIALYGDRLFWTDMQRHQVLSALKKGGQRVSMVLNVPLPTTMRGPGGLRVFHPDAQPAFKNVCSDAKCEQLCLPTSQL
ncbi:Protein T13C2.6 a, partial [Aphelenchoides avenae]